MMLDASAAVEGESSAAPRGGAGTQASWLLCRAGTMLCALPVDQVLEIMRSLPLEPFAAAPQYVLGLSIIHGAPVPVVDIGRLLGCAAAQPTRLVTVEAGGRTIALAMRSVIGITEFGAAAFEQLPPLLQDAGADAVAAVGARDSELLIFLRASRMVPEQVFDALAERLP
jgi:purine-binding chemotaxis protein CheW